LNDTYYWDASRNRWADGVAGAVNRQDGSIFFRGPSGDVYHFTATGQLLWTRANAKALAAAPEGADAGLVCFVSALNDTYYWDASRKGWADGVAGAVNRQDGSVFFRGPSGDVYRFTASGQLLWTRATAKALGAAPEGADAGLVCFVSVF